MPESAVSTASAAMALSSLRRCPIDLTPSAVKSSEVSSESTLRSMSLSRNAGAYSPSPRPVSHSAISTPFLPGGGSFAGHYTANRKQGRPSTPVAMSTLRASQARSSESRLNVCVGSQTLTIADDRFAPHLGRRDPLRSFLKADLASDRLEVVVVSQRSRLDPFVYRRFSGSQGLTRVCSA